MGARITARLGSQFSGPALLLLAVLAAPSHALDVPPHTSQVVDQAGLLDESTRRQLDASLQQFQKQYGPQIQVLTVPSLEGDNLESFSIRVVDAWKLGDAKRDDGILMLLAMGDRAIRIEVGQGLEGQLPDALTGRIIQNTMTPYFQEGRFADGLIAGLQEIATTLGGTLTNAPTYAAGTNTPAPRQGRPTSWIFPLFLFFFFIRPLFGGRRHRRGGVLPLLGGIALGRSMGRGGFGGGGGFGGFGGGGGGGFSGGGASGRW